MADLAAFTRGLATVSCPHSQIPDIGVIVVSNQNQIASIKTALEEMGLPVAYYQASVSTPKGENHVYLHSIIDGDTSMLLKYNQQMPDNHAIWVVNEVCQANAMKALRSMERLGPVLRLTDE